MKLLKALFALGCGAWGCGFCFFVIVPNLLISLTIPQMPFGGRELAEWQLDIPQDSDGANDTIEVRAGHSRVGRDGYVGPDVLPPYGLPLHGPIRHWSCDGVNEPLCDVPLLGCMFRDPFYPTHTGWDLPLAEGQNIYATLGGKVVWAGDNGPWGNLVVIENDGYQIWLAHLSQINVVEGQIVPAGLVIGLSGNTGNSSGPHLHYGIKHFDGPDDTTGTWLDPSQFIGMDIFKLIGCGG